MPDSRTPGFEQYILSDAARGIPFWMLEIMGTLELEVGYVSQEHYDELRRFLEKVAHAATAAASAAE